MKFYTANKKQIVPTFLLMLFLLITGAALRILGYDIHIGGFLSMVFFYGFIFFIGAYASKLKDESKNIASIFLAGRSMPLFVAVFTMSATWVGGGYINGTAEYTASSGLMWVQAPWGYALSLILGGLLFAKKMRRYRFTTMLDPLEQRYGKKITALLFLPALSGEIFWTAAILTALGTTFGTVLGLDTTSSIILSAFVAIAYTAIGGLWAVALTDVFQMIFLLFGLAIVIPYAFEHAGGWNTIWASYVEKKGALASFIPSKSELGSYYLNWWDTALLLIFGGIPWQVYFQRVLAAKDENTARNLSILAGIVCLIAAVPAVLIGIVGDVMDWNSIGIAPPAEASLTLPYVVRYLTPPLIATIGLGTIAAAVMSSVDSSILSASSLATWNVYRPLYNAQASQSELHNTLKRCIWIIGITATLLALNVQSVYALWYLCSDFVYCLLFPPLVCALFDPKANKYGALAGFVVAAILRFGGGDTTLGLPILIPYPMIEEGQVLFPFKSLAMMSGLISIVVVSRLSARFSKPTKLTINQED